MQRSRLPAVWIIRGRDAVYDGLDFDQRAEGQRLVSEWYESHPVAERYGAP